MEPEPILKEPWEIEIMRQAGGIVGRTLQLVRERVKAGVSTAQLDRIADDYIRSQGATPTFKGYGVGSKVFHWALCTSINEEVVHGIPSDSRILKEGDILSVDCGATFKNYIGDSAVTIPVGTIDEGAEKLVDATRGALEVAIGVCRPGGRLIDIARTVQEHAESRGYGLVKTYCGHGVGQALHEPPQVPNYVSEDYGSLQRELKPGLVIAIEPMLTEGKETVRELSDRWTVVTRDGRLSAHFEHTIAITEKGPQILTLP